MKTIKFKTAILIILSMIIVINCQSPEKKIEDAKEDVANANRRLLEAREDSVEYVRYKEDMEAKLEEYEQKIEDAKEGVKATSKDISDAYEQSLNALIAKKVEMKTKLQEYKMDAANTWDVFKYEFNKEIDELGKSISSLAQKNMKNDKEKK